MVRGRVRVTEVGDGFKIRVRASVKAMGGLGLIHHNPYMLKMKL